MQNEPTVRMTAVRRLYEVSARMGAGRSLGETLQAVVDGVVDGLGFGIAVLNLRQPDGKFEVIAVAGSPEAKEALLGTVSAADIFDAEFAIADVWGGLRFVPHERLPEGEVVGWVPDVPVSADPNAWHPLDALFAPLCSSEGELVGMLSVDLPEDQRRPGPIHRELLEIFATQAGLAIDKARLTDQLLAEKVRLEASETTFRLVFEGAGNGMATIAFDGPEAGRVLRVNDAFCRITGYTTDQLVGSALADYLEDEDAGQSRRELDQLTAGQGPYRFERTFRRADGHDIWLGGTAAIVGQGKDQPRILLIQIDDVTARKDAERELQHHAAHDALTGLANRRLLQHRFNAVLQRSRQSGRRGVLLFCDLNHFKQVNDKYGHEAGDLALREIGTRLQAAVRQGDTVARLGGDEFAVLAEEIDGTDLTALVRRIEDSINRPLTGIDVPVTASLGTAVVSPYTADLEELLRTADHAMYEAKQHSRR
ncbi:diguanylate cyclase with PAS/PAC and GAF sensors [Kribbella flavida DSM 17836]|uniref:Diguanylate cyclase with PAS/PAC and GAF sensors n=1 Tax=Kribbella flavida (strain DSM 17836 / JCM 10339 / NBRC 14399) TaxID=479435 RepID=D2PTB3_KRIFD|nr:diguanylate cyclase [Kribbella flavida]ADB29429.1 diguanylate cyclase with PAS/PAC and GAF sensors [Kribbella flavida DSM 17836]